MFLQKHHLRKSVADIRLLSRGRETTVGISGKPKYQFQLLQSAFPCSSGFAANSKLLRHSQYFSLRSDADAENTVPSAANPQLSV